MDNPLSFSHKAVKAVYQLLHTRPLTNYLRAEYQIQLRYTTTTATFLAKRYFYNRSYWQWCLPLNMQWPQWSLRHWRPAATPFNTYQKPWHFWDCLKLVSSLAGRIVTSRWASLSILPLGLSPYFSLLDCHRNLFSVPYYFYSFLFPKWSYS